MSDTEPYVFTQYSTDVCQGMGKAARVAIVEIVRALLGGGNITFLRVSISVRCKHVNLY
jgi:hypothetical protein